MSLDSRRTGFPRISTSSNSVTTITATPGLLPQSSLSNSNNNNNNNNSNLNNSTINNNNNINENNNNAADQQQQVEITYSDLRTIGNGSFGVVFQATLQRPTQEQIAIKKVLQDKRFKNRELQIMRKLDHCNVVKLKYFFHTVGERGSSEVYLHLVLEYIPETLYKIARSHSRTRQNLPMTLVKLYMYQLFRSLNYIHSMDICHRDIKPQNLLLNPDTGVLKLCDFGSAKSLVGGEPNVAYICSRYYRAPELIFGATDYTTKIDIWSAGCVMAELILGEPMFPGESGVDQLVEIIKVLGTPTREQMRAMNPNYTEFRFPVIKARSWNRIFSQLRAPPEAAKLVSNLLEYTPFNRLTPLGACAHPFFDELRSSSTKLLPNGREFPPLFNFSDEELRKEPHLAAKLIPGQISATTSSSSTPTATSAPSSSSSLDPLSQQQNRNVSTTIPSSSSSTTTTTITSSSTNNTQQPTTNTITNTGGLSGGVVNINNASTAVGSSSSNVAASPTHSVTSNVTTLTSVSATSNAPAATISSNTSNSNNNNNNTTTTASNINQSNDDSSNSGANGPERDKNIV